MNRRTVTLLTMVGPLLCPLLCAFGVASTAFAQKDFIWPIDSNTMISGVVRNVSPELVTIEVKGKMQPMSIDQIGKVRFGDDPTGMSNVRSSVLAGQLEQAQDQIASVNPSGRDFVKADVAFFAALVDARLALAGQGSVTSAAGKMNNFLKKHPKSFRYYEACEVMGDLAMRLGRFDSAAKFYSRISASQSTGMVARGKLLQGDAWLSRGDAAKAIGNYRAATKSEDERVSRLAQVGLAACQVEQGKSKPAIAALEALIAGGDSKQDSALFAKAYNALGKAYLAGGNNSAALESFLHTDLLFYRESEQHAEALFHLVGLWSTAQKPAESARAKKMLKSRYATTPWAKK